MNKNKKCGRPKKSATQKLKNRVAYMLPTIEYFALKTRAKNAGISLAEISRDAVTGCRIVPRFTEEESGLLRQLAGMANNLNQLARKANKDGYPEAEKMNYLLAQQIHGLLKSIANDGQNHKG